MGNKLADFADRNRALTLDAEAQVMLANQPGDGQYDSESVNLEQRGGDGLLDPKLRRLHLSFCPASPSRGLRPGAASYGVGFRHQWRSSGTTQAMAIPAHIRPA